MLPIKLPCDIAPTESIIACFQLADPRKAGLESASRLDDDKDRSSNDENCELLHREGFVNKNLEPSLVN